MTVILFAICAVLLPIAWGYAYLFIPQVLRICAAGGLTIAAVIWGALLFFGREGTLLLWMAVGGLIGLLCRYPKHGGKDVRRDHVSVYEDIFFTAGVYGLLACIINPAL